MEASNEELILNLQQDLDASYDELESLKRDTAALEGLIAEQGEDGSCNALITCSQCGERAGCGWCPTLEQCIDGSQVGPAVGSPQCPDYTYQQCTIQSDCSYTSCSACLADSSCGWCNEATAPTCMLSVDLNDHGLCATSLFYHQLGAANYECPADALDASDIEFSDDQAA